MPSNARDITNRALILQSQNNPMNVLQLISSGSGFYGAERLCVTLSVELDRLGINCVVAAFRNQAKHVHTEVLDHARQWGITTEEIPCVGPLDLNAFNAIRRLTARYQLDVIHSHGIKSDLYGLLARSGNRTRVVGTCHSWTLDTVKDWTVSALDRCVLRQFDAVAVVSATLISSLRRFGVSASRLHTIPNGIDCAPFISSALEPSPRSRATMVVGAVGRLAPVKGFHHLLEASALVLRQFPSTTFVVLGDGPAAEALHRRSVQLGVADRVTFAGSSNNMPAAYASFDVFVLPSLSEAMPMSLMEAMAAAKPVVATSVGSIPMMINDHQNGLLVPPADPVALAAGLCELLASREARFRMGSAAQATAISRFAAATMALRYAALYNEACSE
jgi:glycosyltransferase involved in cell wall biosynthesis